VVIRGKFNLRRKSNGGGCALLLIVVVIALLLEHWKLILGIIIAALVIYLAIKLLSNNTSQRNNTTDSKTYVNHHVTNSHEKIDPQHNAEFMIPQYYKHIMESSSLVDKTANVGTFLNRYKFLMQRLNETKIELSHLNNEELDFKVPYYDDLIHLSIDDVDSWIEKYSDKETVDNVFLGNVCQKLIDKIQSLKTKKGRLNNIDRVQNEIKEYKDSFTNKSYYNFIQTTEQLRKETNDTD